MNFGSKVLDGPKDEIINKLGNSGEKQWIR
jgi:ATP-binding cassette subfamily C protein LapB